MEKRVGYNLKKEAIETDRTLGMDIKCLIFDLGNVIFDINFNDIFSCWSYKTGKEVSFFKDRFSLSGIVGEFSIGKIQADEFRKKMNSIYGIHLNDLDFDNCWCSLLKESRKGIIPILELLSKEYRLIALTNTNIIHHNICEIKYKKEFSFFEKILCSHNIGCRKPTKDSYQYALNYLQTDPKNTLFIDDQIENIEGAREMDLNTLWIRNEQSLLEGLTRMGIL